MSADADQYPYVGPDRVKFIARVIRRLRYLGAGVCNQAVVGSYGGQHHRGAAQDPHGFSAPLDDLQSARRKLADVGFHGRTGRLRTLRIKLAAGKGRCSTRCCDPVNDVGCDEQDRRLAELICGTSIIQQCRFADCAFTVVHAQFSWASGVSTRGLRISMLIKPSPRVTHAATACDDSAF